MTDRAPAERDQPGNPSGSPSRRYRLAVVGAIVVLLVGAGLLDRSSRPAAQASSVPATPMAAAAKVRSSAWYCTGGTATKNGVAEGTVVVANAGPRAVNGVVTVFPSQGDPRRAPLQVAPLTQQLVHLTDLVTAPFASALVELDGGEAVVELDVTGSLGESISPCASAASPTWYFADGVTTKDATETLMLFNPFTDDAVVDLVFGTEEGPVTPQSLTGLTVRGEGMTAVNVGEFVQRREQVTAVVTARAGRLVVARLQAFDGSANRKGISLGLGATSPAGLWYFPEGQVADGLVEKYQIFNPGKDEARVEIGLALEKGEAEPLVVTVPGESRITVAANDEARIPKAVAHAVTVRSVNGVGVVAERSVDGTLPSKRVGSAITLGARVAARHWYLAAGTANDNVEEILVLQNPGDQTAHASVTVLGDGTRLSPPELQNLEVGPGQRRAVRLNDTVKRVSTPIVVDSDQPVVVERDLNRVRGLGIAMSMGIPLREE